MPCYFISQALFTTKLRITSFGRLLVASSIRLFNWFNWLWLLMSAQVVPRDPPDAVVAGSGDFAVEVLSPEDEKKEHEWLKKWSSSVEALKNLPAAVQAVVGTVFTQADKFLANGNKTDEQIITCYLENLTEKELAKVALHMPSESLKRKLLDKLSPFLSSKASAKEDFELKEFGIDFDDLDDHKGDAVAADVHEANSNQTFETNIYYGKFFLKRVNGKFYFVYALIDFHSTTNILVLLRSDAEMQNRFNCLKRLYHSKLNAKVVLLKPALFRVQAMKLLH
jgi:hypothetical protein